MPIRLLINVIRQRELLYFLIVKELKARYKQSMLGPAWAILQPLLLMTIFTMMQKFIRIPSDNIPYPVFAYTALLPWTYFSNGITYSVNSIVSHAGVVKKIYFSRELFPIASIATSFFDFLMASIVFVGLLVYYRIEPSFALLYIPVLILVQTHLAIGIGLVVSALTVFLRDLRFGAAFIMQIWMFATPIIYALTSVPVRWKYVYYLNPMVGVIDGYRRVILQHNPPNILSLAISFGVSVVILYGGYFFFKRLEARFADVI